MKGHAAVELTDVNTGRKQVYEEDNIVTDGLQNYLGIARQLFGIQTSWEDNVLPIYCNALGGIMLFNQQIPESRESTRMPDSFTRDNVVGYAAYSTDGTDDVKRGILNMTETEVGEKKVKYVYDFGTDKANGMIQCMSLCPSKYGLAGTPIINGEGYPVLLAGATEDALRRLVKFDLAKGVGYCARKVGTTVELYEITLSGYGKNVNFADKRLTEKRIASVECPEDSESYDFCGNGKYAYGLMIKENKLHYIKISLIDYSLESGNIAVASGQGITAVIGMEKGIMYYYAKNGTYRFSVIRVNMQTGEEKKIADMSEFGKNDAFVLPNGDFYLDGKVFPADDSSEYGIGYSKGSYVERFYKCILSNGFIVDRKHNDRIYVVPSYDMLATVNNLAAPVRKTAAQTMKITYTLTMD